ncbi:ABC transporter ATP-binding protein [Salinadaptatus halalkaliphilus]|uniref:ABC transporter ATP-binding protein n=1 Tax=Salinadaptatus halalkaliphilus TaxID=2419781 RepID=A0A4S3TKU1_9EURY|nr:ABC transporter ATP-binding protein [Salinadaptatus halalkaliphilus]THE63853.1 ABC transporter ATP-binding protein [Salinadaptatus halalkaliphilus]
MSSNDDASVIRTDGLTKRYGSDAAVENLSFTVDTGEIYGFLGPNGAGKSTTINMLMDYARPTEGEISILGMDPREDVVDVHQRVGILPDGFSVYENRTGRDHLRLVIDTKAADDDPEALLERVGLADAVDDDAGSYSRGMRQRLALAMALVGEPELLILDEPFSGLDPHGVRTIRDVAHAENDRGATVFFSSHVLGQVELVCDRIGILHEGRLVAEGTLEELRASAPVTTEFELAVDGNLEQARRAVRNVEGVVDISVSSASDGTTVGDGATGGGPETGAAAGGAGAGAEADTMAGGTIVTHLESIDRREAVVEALERTDMTIRRTTVEEPSIESIFVAHTGGSPAGGEHR